MSVNEFMKPSFVISNESDSPSVVTLTPLKRLARRVGANEMFTKKYTRKPVQPRTLPMPHTTPQISPIACLTQWHRSEISSCAGVEKRTKAWWLVVGRISEPGRASWQTQLNARKTQRGSR